MVPAVRAGPTAFLAWGRLASVRIAADPVAAAPAGFLPGFVGRAAAVPLLLHGRAVPACYSWMVADRTPSRPAVHYQQVIHAWHDAA